jgi:pimeloyl-ACP methyl ester carboxylesterase
MPNSEKDAIIMATVSEWTIPGVAGEPIFGNCHMPEPAPMGVVLIAHGFKGYKDYGMFPRIARACAEAGLIAHRFNFSHAGMASGDGPFERPDLFEQDTWNKQVHDLRCVIAAVNGGTLPGRGLPYVLFGHSRGGVTALLAAGRYADDPSFPAPMGLVTAAAPCFCNSLSKEESDRLLADEFVVSPSARTGQELRIGRAFLDEQLADPQAHDVLALASRVTCAAMVIHGADDPTVPAACAQELHMALGENSNCRIIDGADHVFNTPNPMPDDAEPSPQLAQLLEALTQFARSVCETAED